MAVSQVRDMVGRIVLGALGVAAVAGGAAGVAGLHGAGLRLGAVVLGVAAVGHGLRLVRVARHRGRSADERERQPR